MTGTLSCTLKFLVKDCDPNTGEADDEGYDDEYVVWSSLYTTQTLADLEALIFATPAYQ